MAIDSTVLVTGAQGFLGSHVARRLRREGYRVRGLARNPQAESDFEVVRGDVTDRGSIVRAVEGADAVVHCAASFGPSLGDAGRVNVGGTRIVAEVALAMSTDRFVHISSIGVYDIRHATRIDESAAMWPYDPDVATPYAVTKAEAERALAEVRERGLPAVVLRAGNILGADRNCAHTYRLALGVKEGKIGYAHDIDASWPYVHVENLVDAIVASLRNPAAVGGTFNVVDGHTTWSTYVRTFARWLGVTPPTREAAGVYETFRGAYVAEEAKRTLGYSPRVSFAQALEEAKRFLQAEGMC